MADRVSKTVRRRIMQSVKTRHTGPELAVRRLVRALGFRYRLHASHLLGKPDLTIPALRKVVFVHGCFWHGHECRWGRLPKSRVAFWREKIGKNRARDRRNRSGLRKLGWRAIVVWQCQIRRPAKVAARLAGFFGAPSTKILPGPLARKAKR